MTSPPTKDEILESVVAEFTAAVRSGQAPRIDAFVQRHPQFAGELEELLSSVAMIEQLKHDVGSSPDENSDVDWIRQIPQLGDYRLIREIGRGGMGIVFEATHQSLGRCVAIKVMHQRLAEDPKYVARFRREAQAAANLHHTNIVGVFGVGHDCGRYYYVMEYVAGEPLNQLTRRLAETSSRPSAEDEIPVPPQRFRWVAQLGAQIADALAYAHDQGMLHRDIKPGNLLLDRHGVVWITDFGLVKDFGLDQTMTGDIVGTPQYMAPESFRSVYDERSEVYCLGVTLYELATLQPAFAGSSTGQLIRAIGDGDYAPPRRVAPQIDRDLETIILRAMALEPGARYATAAALRDDLRAYAEDRPIAARQPGLWEQWGRWRRKNPAAAALAGVSFVLLALLALTASVGYLWTADANRRLAQKAQSLIQQQSETELARQAALANLARADANVGLTMKAFDELFRGIISGQSGIQSDIDIDGFSELGGIETSVTMEDAELLTGLLAFYEQFTAQNSENEALRGELARAYRRVANIRQLVGQYDAAVEAYHKALPLFEQLHATESDDESALIQLVQIKSELSTAYRAQGEFRRAGEETRECLETIEQSSLRDRRRVRLEQARILIAQSANEYLLAAPMVARPPADGSATELFNWNRRNARNGRNPSAAIGPNLGRKRAAEIKQAIEILEVLRAEDPHDTDCMFDAAKAHALLAAYSLRQQPEQAQAALAESIAIFERLAERFPDRLEYRYYMAMTYSLNLSEDTELNDERIQSAKRIADELVDKSPNVLEYKKLKVKVDVQHGRRLIQDGSLDQAARDLEEARVQLATLERRTTGDAFWRVHRLLADSFRRLGEQYQARREGRKASDAFRAARLVNAQMRLSEQD